MSSSAFGRMAEYEASDTTTTATNSIEEEDEEWLLPSTLHPLTPSSAIDVERRGEEQNEKAATTKSFLTQQQTVCFSDRTLASSTFDEDNDVEKQQKTSALSSSSTSSSFSFVSDDDNSQCNSKSSSEKRRGLLFSHGRCGRDVGSVGFYSVFAPLVVLLLLLGGQQQPMNAAEALKASLTYVPMGSNPLLYKPGVDPIIHLDQNTFADTVLDPKKRNGYVVEFYADWCGHCRALAPFYKQFAALTRNWADAVAIASVNCADSLNNQICRSNGVAYFPMLKFYPRSALHYNDGQLLAASHSSTNLRDQLAAKILNDFNHANGAYVADGSWPDLRNLEVDASTTFDNLWDGQPSSVNFLLIVFERFEGPGVRTILDLLPYRKVLGIRRAPATSPLVPMLRITDFPYVALFKRGDQQSIFMDRLQEHTLEEVMALVKPGQIISLDTSPALPRPVQRPRVIDCEKEPDRCRQLYFASETDMLKAMRMALVEEVTRLETISGKQFNHLLDFVSLLSRHFPTITFDAAPPGNRRVVKRSTSMTLRKSENAKKVFLHLKELLEAKEGSISSSEWRNQFENAERVFGGPFPRNASWQHCKGSSEVYRGYTCGLWLSIGDLEVTFHTLTVNSYMDAVITRQISPLKPLKAIQGWVNSFFGCEDCRAHFMKMTTELFPMDDERVKHLHDMILYLWRAHNIVNSRLHTYSTETEDPQFPKYQFPPPFLCPTCHSGGNFSRRQVRNFMLRYYASIKPYRKAHSVAPPATIQQQSVLESSSFRTARKH